MKAHRLINRLIISLVVAGVLLVGLLWLLRAGVPGAREIAVELPDFSSPTRPLPAPSPRRSLGLLGYDDDVRVSDTTEPGPGNMCVGVMTGTHLVTLIIKNPNGLGTIHDYHAATFDQRVLSRSSTSAQVEIISRAYFDTTAGYPLDTAALPSEIQAYLLPNSYQQSDHPAIQAQALALVGEAQTEVQAVVAILDWVRANIAYDYTFSLPTDAVSVYQNRSGVCDGFSNLAVALLRAAGIPAKKHIGCVFQPGWVVGPEGGWHAWIEVYYPDAGWVPSDPQTTENFVDTSHLFQGFSQCGKTGTTVSRTNEIDNQHSLYYLKTPYTDTIWGCISSASVLSWDRKPLQVRPSSLTFLLRPDNFGVRQLIMEVDNDSCSTYWSVSYKGAWLSVTPYYSYLTHTLVTLSANAIGLSTGTYTDSIILSTGWWNGNFSTTIPIRLLVVEEINQVYLPVVFKNH